MESEIEITDAAYGFSWCETNGQYYLRSADGDYREVNQSVIEFLRLFAQGELTPEALERQIDGGEVVLAEESGTSPEAALSLFETYLEENILVEDESVTRLIPPDDIRLWPRALLFCFPLIVVVVTVVSQISQIQTVLTDPPSIWIFFGMIPASFVFAGIHEIGHYAVGNAHFDSSIRIDVVNGVVPALVTDTTGAWVLPRNRRIWVNLAGPFVELLAVLPVVFLAWYVPGGIFWSLVTMVVLSHVVFALNPLIHGDGYWIVCDLFDLVNVRLRGREALSQREITWPALYVLASYAFGALVAINAVVLTIYSRGLHGLVFALPFVGLFLLSRIDVDVRPDVS